MDVLFAKRAVKSRPYLFGTAKYLINHKVDQMNNIRKELVNGLREGWALFWSPFVAMYSVAKEIVSTKSSPADARGSSSNSPKKARSNSKIGNSE